MVEFQTRCADDGGEVLSMLVLLPWPKDELAALRDAWNACLILHVGLGHVFVSLRDAWSTF